MNFELYFHLHAQNQQVLLPANFVAVCKQGLITVYSIFFTLQVCGTARHGLVRLWDMRHTQPVQMYHIKHPRIGQSSPVYSVAFDQSNLYVALDQCLSLVSFVNPTSTSRKTNHYNNKVVYYR